MTTILTSTLFSVISFVIFLGAHIIIWRTTSTNKGVLLLTKIAVISYVSITLIELSITFGEALSLEHHLLSLALYLLLTMLYLHFYVGIDRSVSVRILGELAQSKKGAIGIDEIQSYYPPTTMFEHRLHGLTLRHLLMKQANTYKCTTKGAYLAKITLILEKWYRLEFTG